MTSQRFTTLARLIDTERQSTCKVAAFFLRGHRGTPHQIAEATGLSLASVYAALDRLAELGLQGIGDSHDHDHGHGEIGTLQPAGEAASNPVEPEPAREPDDPLVSELVNEGLHLKVARRLLKALDRARAELLLRWHQFRRKMNYPFRKHPAALLYQMLSNPDDPRNVAPEGFYGPQEQPPQQPRVHRPLQGWNPASSLVQAVQSVVPALRVQGFESVAQAEAVQVSDAEEARRACADLRARLAALA